MMWAYTWKEYVIPGEPRTQRVWKPLWDSINYCELRNFGIAFASGRSYFVL